MEFARTRWRNVPADVDFERRVLGMGLVWGVKRMNCRAAICDRIVGVILWRERGGILTEPKILYGGQAVMEGVMMRGRNFVACAVRRADGTIALKHQTIPQGVYSGVWSKTPFLRALPLLWDTLVLGTQMLMWSANEQAKDELAKEAGKEGKKATEEMEVAAVDPGIGEAVLVAVRGIEREVPDIGPAQGDHFFAHEVHADVDLEQQPLDVVADFAAAGLIELAPLREDERIEFGATQAEAVLRTGFSCDNC